MTKPKPRTTAEIIADSVTEAQFTRDVIDMAHQFGWLVAHSHDSRTNHWASDKGFPDLCLARDGRVIFAELKRWGAVPRPEQYAWLNAIGDCAYFWTPLDRDEIIRVLA